MNVNHKGTNDQNKTKYYWNCQIHPPSFLSQLFSGKQKSWMTFLKGREDDETVPRTSTLTDSSKHPFKVKAILNFRLFRFPPTRLLLGLYDYIFKHLAVMEEEECDIITTLQVDGLAQFFGLQELESRTTLFQEGEGDEDILARYVRSHEDHSPANTSDHNHGPLTQSRAKKI